MDKVAKIVVVEDEELLLQVISKKLTSLNYDVVSCKSAKQALDYLKNLDKPADAIWLDYYLEDMSGLDFLREMKKDAKMARIPVIVVSNSASEDKKNAMLALGAKRYILKAEHRLDEIVDTIQEIVEETKRNAQPAV